MGLRASLGKSQATLESFLFFESGGTNDFDICHRIVLAASDISADGNGFVRKNGAAASHEFSKVTVFSFVATG